jgi:hypothetical protein
MDILTFISKITESLAWPFATLGIVFILRKKIETILPFLKKLKAGPIEAEFAQEVKDLRKSVDTYIDEKPLSAHDKKLFQLSEINPRSAILEAWQGVETEARKLVIDLGLYEMGPESRPLLDVYRVLVKNNFLSSDNLALFNELRSLRNQAAHDENFTPTKESSLNYIELAKILRLSIDFNRKSQQKN